MAAPRRHPRAFALPLTLVLLSVAAATMVSVCTRSLSLSADAAAAEYDLQSRWAMESCRRTVLPRAELLLDDAQKRTKLPATCVRYELKLGAVPVELLVTDEQAKVNVDLLLSRLGKAGAEQTIHTLLARRRSDVKIDLRPLVGAAEHPPFPGAKRCGSFSQIFGDSPVSALLPQVGRQGNGGHNMPADDLTCWGDGRINFRRASTAALTAACRGLLTDQQVQSILKLRDSPDATLSSILQPMQLDQKTADAVGALLTVRSACHGLWIIDSRAGTRSTIFCTSDENSQAGDEAILW